MKQTVFVTGATAGIGEATSEIFAKNGYRLIINGRREDRLNALKNKLEKEHQAEVLTLAFDVRRLDEVEQAVNFLPDDWKQIDILINNAGLAVGLGAVQDGIIDDWERMIDTNIKGLLYMTRQIAPMMVARGSGHIINLGSIAGKETYPNGNVYCATKHAVDSLSKAMRIDLLPHGIKVTNIAPGMVETEFSVVRFKGDQQKADSAYQGFEPLRAEDIAETIYWTATRPPHVNINDVLIMPTAQANSTSLIRK